MSEPHNPAGRGSQPGIPGEPVRYDVYCGLDVGKSDHHACALDPAGRRLHDKPMPNDETALVTLRA